MSHHVTSADIPAHGEHLDSPKLERIKVATGIFAVLGFLASIFLLYFAGEHTRGCYAYSWLFAFFYFFTLALGGCFWTLLHNVSNSGWGTSVRRTMENLGSVLPWMAVFALPLACPQVQQYLYEWMNIHRSAGGEPLTEFLHHHNHLLREKLWYMNLPFWYGRFIFFFAGLGAVICYLRDLSTAQDTDPHPGTRRLFLARRHSTWTMIVFAVTITFAGYDFLIGLDYTWFSTMWGVYLFAGSALNGMAVIIITATLLRRAGYLKKVVNGEHFHIMGKLLFAFTVFWAYIAFSQYFLIWYSNQTEETKYFLIRNTGNWNTASIVLVFGHFVLPFVVLLQQWLKRKPALLSCVCLYLLVLHILDMYLIVIPERGISLGNIKPEVFGPIRVTIPGAFWGDIFAFLTVGCGFVFLYLRALGRHSLFPHRDPRILESANVSN